MPLSSHHLVQLPTVYDYLFVLLSTSNKILVKNGTFLPVTNFKDEGVEKKTPT